MTKRGLVLAFAACLLGSFVPQVSVAGKKVLKLCPTQVNDPVLNVAVISGFATGLGDLTLSSACYLRYKGDVTVQAFARGIYRSGHAYLPLTSTSSATLTYGDRVLATCTRTATPPAFSNCYHRSGGFTPELPPNALILCRVTGKTSGAAREDTFLFLEGGCTSFGLKGLAGRQ